LVADDIDVVYVVSPDETHAAYVLQALASGKHVFCEKPLARRSSDYEALADAARRAGTIVQVGMNCRYRVQFQALNDLAASGSMGPLRFIRGTYLQNAVEGHLSRTKPWTLDVPAGINQFLHGGGVHVLDLMRWVAGDVIEVHARAIGGELSPAWPLDTFLASLQFDSGTVGELLVSAAAFRPNEFELEAWFAEGSTRDRVLYRREGVTTAPASPLTGDQQTPDLDLQLADLIAAIDRREVPLNSLDEARKNFETLRAIELSIENQRPEPVAPTAPGDQGRA
jgi:predicted dehydrogenase